MRLPRFRDPVLFPEQYCFPERLSAEIYFPETRILFKAFGGESLKEDCGSSRRAIDEPKEALRRWRRALRQGSLQFCFLSCLTSCFLVFLRCPVRIFCVRD